MFGDGPLLFREYITHESLPLAILQSAVIEFLRGKDDAALVGAHAVNAYVDEVRATQTVDILSTHAPKLAEQLRAHLNEKFHIAVRVREVRDGLGYRTFQLQKPKKTVTFLMFGQSACSRQRNGSNRYWSRRLPSLLPPR